jgi:hypothetical protein
MAEMVHRDDLALSVEPVARAMAASRAAVIDTDGT